MAIVTPAARELSTSTCAASAKLPLLAEAIVTAAVRPQARVGAVIP
jgi:hypothetical protein